MSIKKMIIFFLRKILSALLANQGIGGLLCSAWGGAWLLLRRAIYVRLSDSEHSQGPLHLRHVQSNSIF